MITASSTARTSIQLLMELHLAHDLISSIAVIGGFHEPSSCFGGQITPRPLLSHFPTRKWTQFQFSLPQPIVAMIHSQLQCLH